MACDTAVGSPVFQVPGSTARAQSNGVSAARTAAEDGGKRRMVNHRLQWPRVCGVLKTDQDASHLLHRAAQTARGTPMGIKKQVDLAAVCVCARARVFTSPPVASNTLVARSAKQTRDAINDSESYYFIPRMRYYP